MAKPEINWDNPTTEDYHKADLKKLTREQALWMIHGGRKNYERYRKDMLKVYSREDMDKDDEFHLALARDKDPEKARKIAESIKDPVLREDCLTELKAWLHACIVD